MPRSGCSALHEVNPNCKKIQRATYYVLCILLCTLVYIPDHIYIYTSSFDFTHYGGLFSFGSTKLMKRFLVPVLVLVPVQKNASTYKLGSYTLLCQDKL